MKVVHIQEPNKVQLVEIEKPVCQPGEALLQIKYAGICGADISTFTGNQPFTTYPRIPGHEFSAEIVEVPENDLGLSVGDVVTANPYFNCGTCYSCERGLVNACTSNQTMGVQRDGSFAEYVAMPMARIYKNNKLSAKELALVEPFTISYHAMNRGTVKAGDKVIVVGGGAIGMFALISAKLKGAEVYLVDVVEKRLEMALKHGASGVINANKEDVAKRTEEITKGNGFDICVEAVGHSATFLSCIDYAAFGADIILIGNGKHEATFNHSILLKKELNIHGSRNSLKKDFEEVIDIIAQGKVDVEGLVTDVYDKEDSIQAFEDLVNNDGSRMKSMIKFG